MHGDDAPLAKLKEDMQRQIDDQQREINNLKYRLLELINELRSLRQKVEQGSN